MMAAFLSSSGPNISSSDSESECEDLTFKIDAFQKYQLPSKSNISQNNFIARKSYQLSSTLNPGPNSFKQSYINVFSEKQKATNQLKRQKDMMQKELNETMKNSVVYQPGFEKMEKQQTFQSKRQITKQRMKNRDKTKGYQWFNLPATELTEEKKNDLMVLQMRQAIDPKLFYKRSINKTMPKYFQIGTVVETPADFYSSRVPKKQRKQTLVDELLGDNEFRQYQKRKVAEAAELQPAKYHKVKKVKKTKVADARFESNAQKKRKGKNH